MMPRPTIMVDNNALSNPDLAAKCAGKTIYISDVVFIELFAKGQWQRSVTDCLAPLAAFADHVFTTINLGGALGIELSTGEPTQSILGDVDVNERLGPLLIGCRDEPKKAIEYFKVSVHTAREELALRHQHMKGYRRLGLEIVSDLKEKLTEKRLGQFRNTPELVAGYLSGLDAKRQFVKPLNDLPLQAREAYPLWNGEKMAYTSCCWTRLLLADMCLSIRRCVEEAFPEATDDELMGDRNDSEVIIVGSYADELFTVDKGAKWVNRAVRNCLKEMYGSV